MRVENKAFEDVLMSILVGYIHSKRCCLPFNEEFACRRLSLKSWPKEYIDGFIPKNFRVQQSISRRDSQDGERPCDCELLDNATYGGGISDYRSNLHRKSNIKHEI